MSPRDWTLTDMADAADDEHARNWWRRDPYAADDYPDPEDADAPVAASSEACARKYTQDEG